MPATSRNRGNGEGSIFQRAPGGPWYLSYFDHAGKRRTCCTKTTDKRAAQQILAKKLADVALRREGVIDARQESFALAAARPIGDHVDAYRDSLNAINRNAKHVSHTLRFIQAVIDAGEWGTIADIEPDSVNRLAAAMKDRGDAARTVASYIAGVNEFTRWLWRTRKLTSDPLVSVTKPEAEADRRHTRRMLMPDEWPWLKAAAMSGPDRNGMTGYERTLLYATAVQTGLRSAELRSLTRGQLHLLNVPPFVMRKAGSTKNRKDARQYIKPDLAAELRQHVATKAPPLRSS